MSRTWKSLCYLLLFCGAGIASPVHVTHERRDIEGSGWSRMGRVHPSTVIPLRIALTQNNLHQLEELLLSVSHPESPSYGQHYTPERISETFAPADTTIDAVKDWLLKSGFHADRVKLTPGKGWIEVNVTTKEAEDLLKTDYHHYSHFKGSHSLGCSSYSVPAGIRHHIDFIMPTTQLMTVTKHAPRVSKKLSKRAATSPADSLDTCDQLITPTCLKALYDINYAPVATANNTFGIVELQQNSFLQSDLDSFAKAFNLTGPTTPKLISIDGGTVNMTANYTNNNEPDADIEYGMALTHPQEITVLQSGSGSFDAWLDAVDGSFCASDNDTILQINGSLTCGIITPPSVVSVSYVDEEVNLALPVAQRQCAEYGKLGMMGVSVLYASGDHGVQGHLTKMCLDRNHKVSDKGHIFNPNFPGGCPYVTSVGGTQIAPNNTVNDTEVVLSQLNTTIGTVTSAGGFSNIFSIPSYQAAAVGEYLKYNAPGKYAQFNTSGSRAFPDLSANGANYLIFAAGNTSTFVGTSASTPTVSSMLVLINDARIAAGKGTVGFINPTIYSSNFSDAFTDIVNGETQGCNANITGQGFKAVPGWDPATGLGTPNFSKLLAKWLALP